MFVKCYFFYLHCLIQSILHPVQFVDLQLFLLLVLFVLFSFLRLRVILLKLLDLSVNILCNNVINDKVSDGLSNKTLHLQVISSQPLHGCFCISAVLCCCFEAHKVFSKHLLECLDLLAYTESEFNQNNN